MAFDSYWSSPNSDGCGESVMYRFCSVGQVFNHAASIVLITCIFGLLFFFFSCDHLDFGSPSVSLFSLLVLNRTRSYCYGTYRWMRL